MATLSILPSGRWRAQVRKKGYTKTGTFDTKREAKDWASAIEVQINQVVHTGHIRPRGFTIGKAIELYAESVEMPGRTKRASIARLQNFFDKTPPENLAIRLRDFIDERIAGGTGGVTIAQDLSYLATVLDWARHVRKLDVSGDPVREERKGLKYRKLDTRSKERDRLPTQAELDALFDLWDNNPRQTIPMSTLVRFALASGMRLGEICGITIEDVDRDNHTVIIRQRKDPQKKKHNDQVVPLLPDAWTIIEPRLKGRGRIFPYNPRSVSAAFTRGCKTCGIVDLRFHDLRHAAATEFFRKGLTIELVAIITGHKSWQNLKRYTNLSASDVHAALGGRS